MNVDNHNDSIIIIIIIKLGSRFNSLRVALSFPKCIIKPNVGLKYIVINVFSKCNILVNRIGYACVASSSIKVIYNWYFYAARRYDRWYKITLHTY
jgi:hypothetical protein